MSLIRKSLIVVHRYLGIVLSLLFVVWFLSGIGMMYARGMPRLTPELRLERLDALDLSRIQVTAFEAARPGDIVLLAGKGHKQSIIGPEGEQPWDERAEATAALSAMGYGP